jgi:hypothetical protein
MFDTNTLWIIATIAVGSLIQGVAGFGLGLFAMGILVLLLPVSEAVVVLAILGLFSTAYNLWSVRHAISWQETWPILVTTVPATAAGAYLLTSLPTEILRQALAVMILAGCLATLGTGDRDRLGRAFPWAYLAGLLGGLWGGALNVGGPPAVIYTLWRGWDKQRTKAVLSAYFFVSSLVRVPVHFMTGAATPEVLRRSLIILPFSLLATYCGTRLFRRLSNRYFRYASLGLLVALGLRILFS